SDAGVVAAIRPTLHELTGATRDLDPLLELIGGARFVLIGEASHGTHEFYSIRAKITKRLIAEKGFNAVAVEADWPDAYRINRYVRGMSDDPEAARRARYRYACFEHAGEDPQSYGYAASFGLTPTCEKEVVSQLVEMRRNYAGSDEAFYAEQNARLVLNAERYYRSMFAGRV